MDQFEKTNQEFEQAIAECRALFEKKLHDYKASWRILRPTALTDQLFIKAKRIRSLEIKQESLVGEGIRPEFIALINYGIVGLIQLNKGFADIVDTLLSAGAKAAAANAGGTTVLMLTAGGGHRHKLFPCSVRTKGI